jgi:hypothetical protein
MAGSRLNLFAGLVVDYILFSEALAAEGANASDRVCGMALADRVEARRPPILERKQRASGSLHT